MQYQFIRHLAKGTLQESLLVSTSTNIMQYQILEIEPSSYSNFQTIIKKNVPITKAKRQKMFQFSLTTFKIHTKN